MYLKIDSFRQHSLIEYLRQNTETDQCIKTLHGHTNCVISLILLANGYYQNDILSSVKLINLSIKTELPVSWKKAIITMIPKKDHKSSDSSDYRPISLTSCVGKLAERLIKSRLYPFLEKNKIILGSQSGFCERGAGDSLLFFT